MDKHVFCNLELMNHPLLVYTYAIQAFGSLFSIYVHTLHLSSVVVVVDIIPPPPPPQKTHCTECQFAIKVGSRKYIKIMSFVWYACSKADRNMFMECLKVEIQLIRLIGAIGVSKFFIPFHSYQTCHAFFARERKFSDGIHQ